MTTNNTSYPTKIVTDCENWFQSCCACNWYKCDHNPTNTDFPYKEIADMYANEPIEDWFKRCLEDFPYFVALNHDDYEVVSWKEKWFSQFCDTSPTTKTEDSG